jgi:hypothetical protein
MSEWDLQALEANFDGWRKERAPTLELGKAFERYAVEQILQDAALNDDEIESGIFGGGDDGGVDAMYFFVNRTLIQEDSDVPEPAISADLIILQAKYHKGFSEDAVEKLHVFVRDMLDYTKPTNKLSYLNQTVRDAIDNFRVKYKSILGSQHVLTVTFYYVTKSDSDPNQKVEKRAANLVELVKEIFSSAQVSVQFWGCQKLLAEARRVPKKQFALDVFKSFATADKSVVCLVSLKSYANFLRDDHGALRKSILEPNVRDYQGKRNLVNQDIRSTLSNKTDKEFWWFNNGITILADDCSIAGDNLTITDPEVVNGLQTSQEIFAHFSDPHPNDQRHVMVRVLVLADEPTRNRVIKATNFQTAVEPLSLRSTEQIHFDIEERLKLYDLFYDRKKGKYRNLRKPISKIISIRALAQSLIAIVLQRPNDARGGPQKLLNQDDQYKHIFNESINRDLYVVCALVDKRVHDYLDERSDLTGETKRDVRYYVDLELCCERLQRSKPTPDEIASLLPKISNISDEDLKKSVDYVVAEYQAKGGTDTIAKGPDLTQEILKDLASEYPVLAKEKS